MKKYGRTDSNQTEIVEALRKAGATVQSLAAVGAGVPDLLVGWRGMNFLLEVKDGALPPSERRLTPEQVKWHDAWIGRPVFVVKSAQEALEAIGA
jgi:Holliday junction resolvase